MSARVLVAAGADLSVCGSGAPGFHEKTALDLAEAADSPKSSRSSVRPGVDGSNRRATMRAGGLPDAL